MVPKKSSLRLPGFACVLLVASAFLLFLRRTPSTFEPIVVSSSPASESTTASAPPENAVSAGFQTPLAKSSPEVVHPASPSQKPRLVVSGVYNPPPLEGPHAVELTRIEDLSVTYDAREVPALAAFLTHDAAEVRTAAIDGLVRLGAKEAAEPLRAAAGKVKDPREAVAMLDAADYLELPPMPASMRSKLKASKASTAPVPASSEHKKTTEVGGG